MNLDGDNHGHADPKPRSPIICDTTMEPVSEKEMKPPTEQDETIVREMEKLKEQLAMVTRERDEALAELEFLKKNVGMKDIKPRPEDAMSWLGYVHRLMDVETMVHNEMDNISRLLP